MRKDRWGIAVSKTSTQRLACSLVSGLMVAFPAQAALRNATITGLFETIGEGAFGLTCPCFLETSFQVDDSVVPLYSVKTGLPWGEHTWLTDLYAYSKEALVGFKVTIGNHGWTDEDLIPVRPRSGVEWNADFITDAPLAGGNPSRMWMYFQDSRGQGSFFLGIAADPAYLSQNGWFEEYGVPYRGGFAWDTMRLVVQPAGTIPEPATWWTLLVGGLFVVGVTQSARRRSLA